MYESRLQSVPPSDPRLCALPTAHCLLELEIVNIARLNIWPFRFPAATGFLATKGHRTPGPICLAPHNLLFGRPRVQGPPGGPRSGRKWPFSSVFEHPSTGVRGPLRPARHRTFAPSHLALSQSAPSYPALAESVTFCDIGRPAARQRRINRQNRAQRRRFDRMSQ
jgi:hypothetical protein